MMASAGNAGRRGEIERKLSTVIKEHKTSVVTGDEKSPLSTHNLRTGHTFDWDHVEVVDTQPRKSRCKVTETIHIRLRNVDISWEQGYDLPPIYMELDCSQKSHLAILKDFSMNSK